jgi:hypothetical protein
VSDEVSHAAHEPPSIARMSCGEIVR